MAISADLRAVSEAFRLPDQIFLLLNHPASGFLLPGRRQAFERALALGVLWELREAAMIVFHDGREVEIRRSGELDTEYYGRAIRALEATRAPSMASRRAADLVARALEPIITSVGNDLERRQIVHHEVRRRFLVFETESWPFTPEGRGTDMFLHAAVSEVAREASSGHLTSAGSVGDRRLLALVAVLESLGLLRSAISADSRGQPPTWVGAVGRSLRRYYGGLGGLEVLNTGHGLELADQVSQDFGFYQAVEMCATDWAATGLETGSSAEGTESSGSTPETNWGSGTGDGGWGSDSGSAGGGSDSGSSSSSD